MSSRFGSDTMLSRLIAAFLLLALGIGLTGVWYYRRQRLNLVVETHNELRAIADLKLNQIINWRRERIADAENIRKNRLITANLVGIFHHSASSGARRDVMEWMRSLTDDFDYKSVVLVDPVGRILLSTNERSKPLGRESAQRLREALQADKPILSDIHQGSGLSEIHMDLIIPLVTRRGTESESLGALVLYVDPEMYLYPLVQTWPGASRTAETLLVRREGDTVLYLNDLRHRQNTALTLHIPLALTQQTAVMAAQGQTGIFESVDYRNAPVLAAATPVPHTTWFLIAKIDQEEIYAPLKRQAFFLLLVVLALTSAAGFIVIFWWRQRNAEHVRKQYEAELKSAALMKQRDYLSRYANDIIVLIDHDNGPRVIDANERAVAAYGWSREELLRMTLPDLLPPGSEAQMAERIRQFQEEGGALFESVHRRRDGTTFPVEISVRMIEMEGRRLSQGIIREITERKHAEQAIRENEERYRLLIELSPDMIAIHSDGKFVYVNRACATLLGAASPDQLIGKGIMDFVHPDYHALVRARVQRSLGSNEMAEFIAEKFVRLDGSSVDVEVAAVPFRYRGNPAMIVIARDLSTRKEAEQARMESEKRYKRLVESVTDYIYTVEVSSGRAVSTHHGPGCVTVTGYTTDEYQSDPGLWYRMIYDEDKTFVVEQANRILSGAQTPPFEHRILHKDGSLRWVRNTPVLRFANDGNLTAYDGMISDITQLKLLENQLRQAQKMEAVGQLAGGVAHDFNNILTAIIGYANLLLMKMAPDNVGRTFVGQILTSAERAAHLTHSLLAFSRKQIIDLRPVKVNEIIQRVEALLRRVIGEDIELRCRTADPNLFVLADGMQIEQCLMNLATNARDAMPEGGTFSIEIDPVELGEDFVRAHSYAKPGKYALICVSDTGVGMDDTVRSRIFEPFFTTKETGKGTGLGLAMVYGIVKQHNGYIHVYSEPGQGTMFKIYLPLIAALDEKREHQPQEEIRGGRETVLLAEDDATVRELSANVLRNFGYTVIEAVDGEAAVRKFTESKDDIDLLVLDIIMPKKTGKDAYQEISALRPGIKAIFTSGYTADIVHKKGILDTGMDFIFKPSAPAAFLKKVREVLDRK